LTVPRYAGHIFNPGQFSMKIPGQISVEINTLDDFLQNWLCFLCRIVVVVIAADHPDKTLNVDAVAGFEALDNVDCQC
jgi:hypothetical protein